VGVPDFEAGAMENWGLLTFRESKLLVDPDADDVSQMMAVGATVWQPGDLRRLDGAVVSVWRLQHNLRGHA
ncbi:predicted protein, partial [Haematococcus lacustris]